MRKWLIRKLGLEEHTILRVCIYYYYQHLNGKLDNKIAKWLRIDLNRL